MSREFLSDSNILVVSKPLAKALGIGASIALRRIQFWLEYNEGHRSDKFNTHFHDGCWWARNGYQGWTNDIEIFSRSTIRRLFNGLEKLGLIIATDKYNRRSNDQTKWYTINYESYDAFIALWKECKRPMYLDGKQSPVYNNFLNKWRELHTPVHSEQGEPLSTVSRGQTSTPVHSEQGGVSTVGTPLPETPESLKTEDSKAAKNAASQTTSSPPTASDAPEQTPPITGLLKTRLYPVNGAVYDDPFKSRSAFEKVQGKGYYTDAAGITGKQIMDDPELAGLQLVRPDKLWGYTKSRGRPAPTPEKDPLYHVIAQLWKLPVETTGRIYQLKHFLLGTATKGEWASCALNPPMDLRELRSYAAWRDEEMHRNDLEMPEAPAQIQKSVIEFRRHPQYQFYVRRFSGDPLKPPVPEERLHRNDGVSRGKSVPKELRFHQMPPAMRRKFLVKNGYTSDAEYIQDLLQYDSLSNAYRQALQAMAEQNELCNLEA